MNIYSSRVKPQVAMTEALHCVAQAVSTARKGAQSQRGKQKDDLGVL
jgi:hypothetical protein